MNYNNNTCDRKKIFVLGVGAQKAGTTWLYSQLKRNPNVNLGFLKEYHVFDAIFLKESSHYIDSPIGELEKSMRTSLVGNRKTADQARLISFLADTNNYFDYFDYLHCKNPNVELVGDITPAYSMLGEKHFSHIKQGLEARGFEVKVVFLMRDPIERIWSMVRMKYRKQKERGNPISKSVEDSLKEAYCRPQGELRTRYELTMNRLENVFDKSQIFYGFYEALFTEETYFALGNFLNIDLQAPDFEFKANVSPKNELISPKLCEEIANYYRATYNEVAERFGSVANEMWLGYKSLGLHKM